MGVRRMTIKQAMQYVADNPVPATDAMITLPVSELVCRTLFEMANTVSSRDARSLTKANAARRMIFDRLVGRRRPGSHPATASANPIHFHDLTGELDA